MNAIGTGKKLWWCSAFAGCSLTGLMFFAYLSVIFSGTRIIKKFNFFQITKELLIFWVIGSLVSLVFGAPTLCLIDRYFKRFEFRYILGALVSAWGAWLMIAGPLFSPEHWFQPIFWIGVGLGHVGNYLILGLIVGVSLTVRIRFAEKQCDKLRQTAENI